jgi:CO/xanthine dehydrogenase Mo-binding subunit
MRDIPPLKTVLIEAPAGDGPFGARMIGELTNIGVPAAVINAIDDAAEIRLFRFPVSAEQIYDALHG